MFLLARAPLRALSGANRQQQQQSSSSRQVTCGVRLVRSPTDEWRPVAAGARPRLTFGGRRVLRMRAPKDNRAAPPGERARTIDKQEESNTKQTGANGYF